MLTLVKINVLTDDEAIPTALRDQLTDILRAFIQDDPEGATHARVSLEWKHTIHNRDYMAALPPTAHAERISPRAPVAPKKPAPRKAVRR